MNRKSTVFSLIIGFMIFFTGCVSKPHFSGKGDMCGMILDENLTLLFIAIPVHFFLGQQVQMQKVFLSFTMFHRESTPCTAKKTVL